MKIAKKRIPVSTKLEVLTNARDSVTGKRVLVIARQSAVYRIEFTTGETALRHRDQLRRVA